MNYQNRDKIKDDLVMLSHGDGGVKTSELLNNLILKYLNNSILNRLEDSAVLCNPGKKIAFTSDSFVVDPIFFPGGDIGKLCICGTINDLLTSGSVPSALSFSVILEEGFSLKQFEKILKSMQDTLKEINKDGLDVSIVTGDTKVVNKGSADKIYINTAGIGFIEKDTYLSPSMIKPGDDIILNGSIGEHGITILSQREEFDFQSNIKSDCAPLNSLVMEMMSVSKNIHAIRDATRGGLARVLIELADSSGHDFEIDLNNIPIKKETKSICEFLGMDPLYIANEGKIVTFVNQKDSADVLKKMQANKYGIQSRIIGRVSETRDKKVRLNTGLGTSRYLDLHYSEQLPRIC